MFFLNLSKAKTSICPIWKQDSEDVLPPIWVSDQKTELLEEEATNLDKPHSGPLNEIECREHGEQCFNMMHEGRRSGRFKQANTSLNLLLQMDLKRHKEVILWFVCLAAYANSNIWTNSRKGAAGVDWNCDFFYLCCHCDPLLLLCSCQPPWRIQLQTTRAYRGSVSNNQRVRVECSFKAAWCSRIGKLR